MLIRPRAEKILHKNKKDKLNICPFLLGSRLIVSQKLLKTVSDYEIVIHFNPIVRIEHFRNGFKISFK